MDGRFFPWGDHFDSYVLQNESLSGRAISGARAGGCVSYRLLAVRSQGHAGGMREICWTEVAGDVAPVMRGGCWSDTGLFCRVAFRHLTQPDFVNTGLGFRLAKDFGE